MPDAYSIASIKPSLRLLLREKGNHNKKRFPIAIKPIGKRLFLRKSIS